MQEGWGSSQSASSRTEHFPRGRELPQPDPGTCGGFIYFFFSCPSCSQANQGCLWLALHFCLMQWGLIGVGGGEFLGCLSGVRLQELLGGS